MKTFTGSCSGGPWVGLWVEADVPRVPHESVDGIYQHNGNRDCWDWIPAMDRDFSDDVNHKAL